MTIIVLCLSLTACASTGARRAAQTGFVVLQVLDVHSSHQAIQAGAREGNPWMPDAWQLQALIKAPSTFFFLQATERGSRWSRRHRVIVTALITAIDVGYAVIVRRNYQLARGGQ